jgi:hypothetical protein
MNPVTAGRRLSNRPRRRGLNVLLNQFFARQRATDSPRTTGGSSRIGAKPTDANSRGMPLKPSAVDCTAPRVSPGPSAARPFPALRPGGPRHRCSWAASGRAVCVMQLNSGPSLAWRPEQLLSVSATALPAGLGSKRNATEPSGRPRASGGIYTPNDLHPLRPYFRTCRLDAPGWIVARWAAPAVRPPCRTAILHRFAAIPGWRELAASWRAKAGAALPFFYAGMFPRRTHRRTTTNENA